MYERLWIMNYLPTANCDSSWEGHRLTQSCRMYGSACGLLCGTMFIVLSDVGNGSYFYFHQITRYKNVNKRPLPTPRSSAPEASSSWLF